MFQIATRYLAPLLVLARSVDPSVDGAQGDLDDEIVCQLALVRRRVDHVSAPLKIVVELLERFRCSWVAP